MDNQSGMNFVVDDRPTPVTSEEDKRRARLIICEYVDGIDEIRHVLRMLGLLDEVS